jgi:hypothetical protein
VFNSVTLDANKHYSLLFTICDQQFTLEEWTTSLGAISTTLEEGETFDVQALFETPVSNVPSGTNVFWEYWGDKEDFSKRKDLCPSGSHYVVLLCETNDEVTQQDVTDAENAIKAALPARDISMSIRQKAVYTSDTPVQFTLHHQYEDSQRELTQELNSGDRTMQQDMYVEVAVATLDGDMVGPDATTEDGEGGTQTLTWREGRCFYPSLDESTAIIALAPKVGNNSYNANLLTSDMVDAYVTEFGAENILSFEAFKTLKNSSAYTDEEMV